MGGMCCSLSPTHWARTFSALWGFALALVGRQDYAYSRNSHSVLCSSPFSSGRKRWRGEVIGCKERGKCTSSHWLSEGKIYPSAFRRLSHYGLFSLSSAKQCRIEVRHLMRRVCHSTLFISTGLEGTFFHHLLIFMFQRMYIYAFGRYFYTKL